MQSNRCLYLSSSLATRDSPAVIGMGGGDGGLGGLWLWFMVKVVVTGDSDGDSVDSVKESEEIIQRRKGGGWEEIGHGNW